MSRTVSTIALLLIWSAPLASCSDDTSAPAIVFGGPCAVAENCQSEQCLTQLGDVTFWNGYCTNACPTGSECGSGAFCVSKDGFNFCALSCTITSGCSRPGYRCEDVSGNNTASACLPDPSPPPEDVQPDTSIDTDVAEPSSTDREACLQAISIICMKFAECDMLQSGVTVANCIDSVGGQCDTVPLGSAATFNSCAGQLPRQECGTSGLTATLCAPCGIQDMCDK